ncbi:MAG: extracellular solute-binding protein [Myxococcales bacterium]|nr:extracellular solute-binding protein [Myxococcales bacterium]MCB9733429.1 extracellular solute-binding protein [Deltaproteobacteria bacterium]
MRAHHHLAALGLGVLLAACGGKNENPPPTSPPPATTAPAEPATKPSEMETGVAPAEADATAEATAPAEADAGATAAPPAAGEPVEVVLWHSYRAGELDAFNQVVDNYNKSQNEVHIRSQAIPYDPFVDKITITVPRGQGPDLFIFAHNMIGNWVEKGVLEPISGKVEGDYLKQFLPDSVKALVYRKNLYGLPIAFKSLVMFYNKDLLPEAPATMEELVPKVKALQTDDRSGIVYQAGGLYFHAMWIYAFGGQIFNDEHKPAFATPEQVQAVEYVRGLHFDQGVVPGGITGSNVTSLFNQGNAVVVFNGPWFRPEIQGVNYGVATIPTVDGKTPKPMLGIEAVFVTKTSEKKEAALKAAMYLAGAESAKVRMEVGKQPVCQQETLEAGAKADPVMNVFMEQAKNAVLMDSTPEMQVLWTPADIAIAAGIFVKDRDPKAELDKAQAKMEADIGKLGQ